MSHLSEKTVAAILKMGRIYEVGGVVRDRMLTGSEATKDCDYLVTGVEYD